MFTLSDSAWVMIIKNGRDPCQRTCCLSNRLYLFITHVTILYPVPSSANIFFYLFLDSCSAYKFFEAGFVLIYNADVLCGCKFFESRRSAANLHNIASL